MFYYLTGATVTAGGVQESGKCSSLYSKARAAAVPRNSQLAPVPSKTLLSQFWEVWRCGRSGTGRTGLPAGGSALWWEVRSEEWEGGKYSHCSSQPASHHKLSSLLLPSQTADQQTAKKITRIWSFLESDPRSVWLREREISPTLPVTNVNPYKTLPRISARLLSKKVNKI